MNAEKVALNFIKVYKKYKDRSFPKRKDEEGGPSLNDSKRRRSSIDKNDQEEHTS